MCTPFVRLNLATHTYAVTPLGRFGTANATCSIPSLGPAWLSRDSIWLRAGRFEIRTRVGARFFVPVQAGPGAHPASSTMGIGSSPRVKRPGRGIHHPHHLSPRLKKE